MRHTTQMKRARVCACCCFCLFVFVNFSGFIATVSLSGLFTKLTTSYDIGSMYYRILYKSDVYKQRARVV